jgi:phytanoyl-CoA hydroxylase
VIASNQIQRFREAGYLIVNDLLTAEECAELNEHAWLTVEGKVPLGNGDGVWMEQAAIDKGLITEDEKKPEYLSKIGHRMHMTEGVFNKYTVHRKMVSVLQQLIGSDVKCVQSMFLDKPPGLGVGQPYHQDSHYLKTDPDTLLAAWIACDDADPENGGLFVVPGSHHDPVQPHEEPVDPAQRDVYVEVRSARSRREQAVPLKAGSAVFFPGHMLHRSGHNRTDRRRRAFALHYANAKSRWLNEPTALYPFLSVCGREYPGCL